jgi:hypothetical protein
MMRFKYSFTLWVEKDGFAFFVLPPAIAFTVAASEFNSFSGGLYYFINIVGFVIGYIAGLVTWTATTEWMRRRTLWAGDWENKYSKSIIPVRYDGSKIEKSIEEVDREDNINKEEKWRDIHISFAFGKTPIQTFFFFLVSLILLANEYSQFKENELAYSTRVFLDSSAFFIAFLYISNPVFVFIKYILAIYSLNADYAFGSFWHKFHLFKVLIINSIIYGFAAYYTHQLFLTFE